MRWALRIRPHDRFYHVVRFWMELPVIHFQYKYDREWDETLSTALDLGAVEVDSRTATLGDFYIWTRNYPYACGEGISFKPTRTVTGRPSIMTIKRLMIYVKEREKAVTRDV